MTVDPSAAPVIKAPKATRARKLLLELIEKPTIVVSLKFFDDR